MYSHNKFTFHLHLCFDLQGRHAENLVQHIKSSNTQNFTIIKIYVLFSLIVKFTFTCEFIS